MNVLNVQGSTLIERLRRRQWRITAQRRAVAEVLSEEDIHLSADQVYTRARAVLPEISRATVYNTLGELVDMGEVQEVQLFPGPALYDPNAHIEHHHLVCTHCGAIFDIQPLGVEKLQLLEKDAAGFSPEKVEVVFRGLCAECRK